VALALGVLVLAGLVFLASFVGGLLRATFPSDASAPASGRAYLLASNGYTFAQIKPTETRVPLQRLDQVSLAMQQAIKAAEDERFDSHGGVDPLAIARAAYNDATGRSTQGGSTITQQYVKNVYTGGRRTALRKVREAALAVRLDNAKSKDEILRLYLNSVYFGNNTYGIEAAALFYFDKHAVDLTYGEASMLAGLVSAPSVNNPVASFDNAKSRQQYVLGRMQANGYLTPEQASAAYADISRRSIKNVVNGPVATAYPEYADMVTEQVRAQKGSEDLLKNGDVVVRTPMDRDLADAARTALADVLPVKADPDAAVVGINPQNGDIVTIATRQQTTPKNPQGVYARFGTDLATTIHRNSGSTVKPLTLAAALEAKTVGIDDGVSAPATQLLSVDGCPGKAYQVENAEHSGGYYTYASALAESVNTVYAPLAAKVGLDKVKALATKAGIPTVFKGGTFRFGFDGEASGTGPCPVYPSQSLGIAVSPLDMAGAYASFMNGGMHYAPRVITKVVPGANPQTEKDVQAADAPVLAPTRVMSTPTAKQVHDAMRGVVVGNGTAAGALGMLPTQFPDLVGKTGTTQGENNAWFIGCRPKLCLAVWMGNDDEFKDGKPNSMNGTEGVGEVFGGTLPAKIFAATYGHYQQNLADHNRPPLTPGASAAASLSPAGPVAPAGSPAPVRQQPTLPAVPVVPPTLFGTFGGARSGAGRASGSAPARGGTGTGGAARPSSPATRAAPTRAAPTAPAPSRAAPPSAPAPAPSPTA